MLSTFRGAKIRPIAVPPVMHDGLAGGCKNLVLWSLRRIFMTLTTIIIQFRPKDQKMRSLSKALLLSLLIVLLSAQTTSVDNPTYTLEGQSYLYIYGDGQAGSSNTARTANSNSYIPDSTYTPPATGPAPATITCPINQVYDNILCQCVCAVGFYFVGNTCVEYSKVTPVCGKNQVYQNSRCVCAIGYFLIGSTCDVCPPYSTYNLPTTSCICAIGYELVQGECRLRYTPPPQPPTPEPVVCRLNEQNVNGICTCLPDFYLIKGVCTYCIAPNYYDAQFSICRPKCGQNQVLDINTNTCVCSGGFVNVNGQCGVCPPYSVYNRVKAQCECIIGYIFNSGACIPATTPPTRNELPVQPSECSDPNAFYIDGYGCVCSSTYHLIGGLCQQCPINTFYDSDLGICRIACLANESFNIVTGNCDCAPLYFRINATCTKCPGNTTYNAQTATCSCPTGYRQTSAGNCVIGCGVNEVLNNGICCCITGYYPVGGICGQCAWNQVYDQGLGICRIPCDSRRIFDLSKQACVCLPQYYELLDGTCSTCPVQSTYSPITKQCVCNNGYLKNLGLCTSACNAYEEWINGTCQCKSGYYLIGYSCGVCPPTQVYDRTYRICHAACKVNEVWDPTIRACRCLPSYYLVGGMCSICDPRTQVYDQKNQCCNCIDGYKKASGQGCNGVCSPVCAVNEDWIQGRCVCKPGYYLINNFCTQCPAGQFYDVYQRICRIQCGTNQIYNFNTGKCDCAQGYYIVQGICSKCQPGETYDQYKKECTIIPCQGVNEFYSATTQTCVCLPQYVRIQGVCTNCSPGYYYDSYSDRCLCKPGFIEKGGFCNPICPSDQTYVNGKCQCNNGVPLYNGKCVAPIICPLNSRLDTSSNCCVCNPGFSVIGGKCTNYQYCGINGYLKYGQCYCNSGYFWINGACRPCGTNQGFNGVSCECYLGFTADVSGNCVQSNFQPICYQSERYDSTLKACVCVTGTQYVRGKCVQLPTCPANAYYNSIACVCNTGFQLLNGQCVAINTVVPTCPTNAFFNGVSCTCNVGFYQASANGCSSCPAGTSWDGNTCGTQPARTCATGYVFNVNSNQCEPSAPSCGDNAYFNGACCVCVTGFNLINGVCQQCPVGTGFDGTQCSAKAVSTITCGSNQIAVDGKCVCNSGLYLINDQCLSCPPYTVWNGSYCKCDCDVNPWCFGRAFSVFDTKTNTCSCQSGYILVNGVCTAN